MLKEWCRHGKIWMSRIIKEVPDKVQHTALKMRRLCSQPLVLDGNKGEIEVNNVGKWICIGASDMRL